MLVVGCRVSGIDHGVKVVRHATRNLPKGFEQIVAHRAMFLIFRQLSKTCWKLWKTDEKFSTLPTWPVENSMKYREKLPCAAKSSLAYGGTVWTAQPFTFDFLTFEHWFPYNLQAHVVAPLIIDAILSCEPSYKSYIRAKLLGLPTSIALAMVCMLGFGS